MKIRLLTRIDTREGTAVVLERSDLPPFLVLPEIVLLGDRAFQRFGFESQGLGRETVYEYLEVYAYSLGPER